MKEYLEPDSDLPYYYGQRVANKRETVFGHIIGHKRFPFTISVSWDGGAGFGDYTPDELVFYPSNEKEPQREWRRSMQPDFYNEPDYDFDYDNRKCEDIQDCEDCPLKEKGKCPND